MAINFDAVFSEGEEPKKDISTSGEIMLLNEDEYVAGVVTAVATKEHYDKVVPLITLAPGADVCGVTTTEAVALLCGRTALQRDFADVQPGDTIAAKNTGQVTVKSGKWAGKPAWSYATRVKQGPRSNTDMPVDEPTAQPPQNDDPPPF